jgi:predicted O-methyltransferase YrrM
MTIAPSHFWFRSAYERILETLPHDQPTQWVEVGVLAGASTVWLGERIIERDLPVMLHAVDTFEGWDETPQGAELRALFDDNTREIAGALGPRFCVHAMESLAASTLFADGSVDVVWLDADHSYEAVKADIAAWLPKIRPGGVLGGDDWAFEGVEKAVRESCPRYVLGDGVRGAARWPWWMVRV